MKTHLRTALAVFVLSLAVPVTGFAQQGTCPSGFTFTSLPGGGFECTPNSSPSAPEISASTSSAGLVLVAGMALIIRGRKRFQTQA